MVCRKEEGGRRRESWNLLRNLSNLFQLPWCIIGDFNDILASDEKKGRSDRQPWLIQGFRQAVLDAGLADVHMDGYAFTWFKSLGTVRAVEEKLDRALANNSWFDKFQNAKLECLTTTSSDHYPLLLDCKPQPSMSSGQCRFRFENAWLVEPEFAPFVAQRWQNYGARPLLHKLNQCALDLTKWSKNVNQNTRQEIRRTQRKLEVVRTHVDASNVSYFNMLRHRLDKLLIKDDVFWKQRAKTFWYRDGDLNTKFFHAAATTRRKLNRIEHLEDENGFECRSADGMKHIARDYFMQLFQQSNSSRADVINLVPASITREDNDMLTTSFTMDEFKQAVFSMQADKCPGPDGFNPGFYQQFWDTCGSEVFQAGCQWLENGVLPPHVNSTNITLIPKGNSQTSMKDWRPIALCNVVYKIVAKVLANRLKQVLDRCISINQSAFVPGRSILDNAMVAIEIVHYMKTKAKMKSGDVALKLDISKAYDRIDWDYLRDIMVQMGFSSRWVSWIMMCVETVDYSVLFNGASVGPIVPGRGLRQGDPLSPYLFIICAEGLSSLIREAERRNEIRGAMICTGAPIISHLLFADDCFLFFKACESEAIVMKNILATYEAASG